jgi:hypothetical protein
MVISAPVGTTKETTMTHSKIYKQFLPIVVSLFTASSALAESSKEYAIMGRSSWTAFECSVLAGKIENTKEQERLFLFGYEQGLKFIDALQSNKIKQSDLSSEIPLAMGWSLQGPTPDFMLGRVFEVAMEYALKDVYKTGNTSNNEETQKIKAERKFTQCNCKLIGQK